MISVFVQQGPKFIVTKATKCFLVNGTLRNSPFPQQKAIFEERYFANFKLFRSLQALWLNLGLLLMLLRFALQRTPYTAFKVYLVYLQG